MTTRQQRTWAHTASTGVPPQPPELRRGACVGHPRADWWCSSNIAEVEAAKRICHACPVEQLCRSWSLSLRASDDLVMTLGGLSAPERKQIRRQRANQRAWETRKRDAAA